MAVLEAAIIFLGIGAELELKSEEMKILIKRDAVSGKVVIPQGEYMAAALPDRSGIQLTGRGMDIFLPAVRRPIKGNSRVTKVQFYSMGGNQWTLAIALPKRGEWVAFIQLQGGVSESGGGDDGGGDGSSGT